MSGQEIERKKIFLSDVDRNDFINRVSELSREGAMEIYVWVLMPNHFHILKELNRNPWSGHSSLVGKVKREWQNTDYVLSFFAGTGNSRKNYSHYVGKGIEQRHRPELAGGGLIRSMGGLVGGAGQPKPG